jgi:anti-sigma factor RsiW
MLLVLLSDRDVEAFPRAPAPGRMRRKSDSRGDPMNCSLDLIEAYLDQELNATQHAALEQHVAGCPNCSEVFARLRKQKASIKTVAPYFNAPPGLRESIGNELRRVGAQNAKPPTELPWRWLAIAASLLLALSVSWNLMELRSHTIESDLPESVLTDHIRSLLGTHLVDVVSSDQHTVRPWFAGKLDFSPDVKDLESQGFPLVGGRIEYLAGRRVAALVYHRRQHVINLFIWPGESSSGNYAGISRNGYNLLHWTAGPMTCWAVSDVSAVDLNTFRSLYR